MDSVRPLPIEVAVSEGPVPDEAVKLVAAFLLDVIDEDSHTGDAGGSDDFAE